MRRGVSATVVLLCGMLVAGGCAVVERTEQTPTPTPSAVETEAPAPTPEPTPSPSPELSPESTPTPAPTSTPTDVPEPTPTPEPEPEPVRVVTESECCGLFDWMDEERLLVFDQPEDQPDGAYLVDVDDGERSYISEGFGITSPSGVIALLEPGSPDLTVRDAAGEMISTVPTDGVAAWPSPDGSKVAWLEPLPVRTPSSSVNREVQLLVADVETGERRPIRELRAQNIQWLPDSQHVITLGRGRDFEAPGVWLIDTETGNVEILHEETFIRSLQLSPDGTRVSFMRHFNDDPAENGVWTLDIESGERQYAFESGSVRWDADSRHLWRLEMGETGVEADRLLRYDPEAESVVQTVELQGQVLNEQWKVSPDGERVAYWRIEDEMVVVQDLR